MHLIFLSVLALVFAGCTQTTMVRSEKQVFDLCRERLYTVEGFQPLRPDGKTGAPLSLEEKGDVSKNGTVLARPLSRNEFADLVPIIGEAGRADHWEYLYFDDGLLVAFEGLRVGGGSRGRSVNKHLVQMFTSDGACGVWEVEPTLLRRL